MTNAARLVIGVLILFFGRRLFWLFVAAAGFVVGWNLATQYMAGQPEVIILLIAVVGGIIGAVLGLLLQGLAIAVAGFLAGGYLAVAIITALGLMTNSSYWIIFVIGGLIGLLLVGLLFDWALIILSSLLGTQLILQSIVIPATWYWIVFIGLVIIGIAVQASLIPRGTTMRRRGYLRRRRI